VLFGDILNGVLESTHGAIGAVFLDSEGESVEVVTAQDNRVPEPAGDFVTMNVIRRGRLATRRRRCA